MYQKDIVYINLTRTYYNMESSLSYDNNFSQIIKFDQDNKNYNFYIKYWEIDNSKICIEKVKIIKYL